jgi:hypothetical protein
VEAETVFLTAVFLAGPLCFTAFASVALVPAAFFRAAFLEAFSCCALAALTLAHRSYVAAMILAIPALLIRRLGFGASGVASAGGSDSARIFAHLRCWASFMCRRAAAEIFFRFPVGASGVVGVAEPPGSIARSSAILVSICRLCSSNPRMAAVMISLVSFVGIRSPVNKTVYRSFDAGTAADFAGPFDFRKSPPGQLSRKLAIRSERLRGFQQLRGGGSVPLPAIIFIPSGARPQAWKTTDN